MRKFHFKFEKLLHLRKLREDEALQALAEAQRLLQVEKDGKEFLLSELTKAFERKDQIAKESVEISQIGAEQEYITGTNHRIVQAEAAIFRASRRVERAFAGFLDAKRKKRMIELLEEKKLKRFQQEEKKREAKQADDLLAMRMRFRSGPLEEEQDR